MSTKNKKKGFEVYCKDVGFSPAGQPEREILKAVNLTVGQGEFVTIIGGNGTGKSTLLKAIAGEIPLTTGTITVGGRIINGPINSRIDGVGIVHQKDDEDLLHAFSCAMNVAFRQTNNRCHPNIFWACSKSYCASIAKKIAEQAPQLRVDVDQLVGHLSGGERQMLNMVIATHLEHEQNPCRLILLDEHTSGLDHTNATLVMDFTQAQIEETETTAIMVTHRYPDAIKYSDRIVVMGEGEKKEEFDNTQKKVTLDDLRNAVEKYS
jgi:putative ABC transport system ATP-binding protein